MFPLILQRAQGGKDTHMGGTDKTTSVVRLKRPVIQYFNVQGMGKNILHPPQADLHPKTSD